MSRLHPIGIAVLVVGVTMAIALDGSAVAEDGDRRGEEKERSAPPAANQLELSHPRTCRLVVAIELTAEQAAQGIVVTAPVPIEWPEQRVKLLDDRKPPGAVTRITHAAGKADILICSIPNIDRGATVRIERTYEITRYRVKCAADPQSLRIPAKLKPGLREFTASAPGIELKHAAVKALHAELEDAALAPWDQARRHYDWVRANLKFEQGPYRGAAKALETKAGDCEDFTALFVALCRSSGIPARSVWIEGHAYAEFHLEDVAGAGIWIPCELTGEGTFGSAADPRPIFQKGDEFPDPITRRPQRYVPQSLKATGGPVHLTSTRTVQPSAP